MLSIIQSHFFTGVILILALCILACLVAAIKGPTLSDRIVAGNMIGTLTIITICILSYKLTEGWLVDVALIYAMISFLAVVVLTKIFIGRYKYGTDEEEDENEENDGTDTTLRKGGL